MKSVKTVCGMWQTEIFRQWIWVEGRRFTVADRAELCRLAACGPKGALRDVYAFLAEWFSDAPDVEVQTSGSTGVPKRMRVEKRRMVCSACRTCGFLSLKEGDTALLCMNMKYIGAKMMVVRALVAGLRLMVRPASGSPLSDVEERVDFLSVVPMQLYRCVRDAGLRERLSRVRCVIVGGGAVDESLCQALQELPCAVYSTYGMTETLSHVALRRLNGPDASEHYVPLEGIRLSLSGSGTLVVDAPDICAGRVVTNDVVCLYADGTFTVLGRTDNVVNSGGVKIQTEEDERILRGCIPVPFALTSVPDACLGEALVLLVQDSLTLSDEDLRSCMSCLLPRYHLPRHIVRVLRIPETENGKVDRRECRELVVGILHGRHR